MMQCDVSLAFSSESHHISEPTLVWCRRLCAHVEPFLDVRLTDSNVEVIEVEQWIGIRKHFVVGGDNLLDVLVDEIVERIDVLLH